MEQTVAGHGPVTQVVLRVAQGQVQTADSNGGQGQFFGAAASVNADRDPQQADACHKARVILAEMPDLVRVELATLAAHQDRQCALVLERETGQFSVLENVGAVTLVPREGNEAAHLVESGGPAQLIALAGS